MLLPVVVDVGGNGSAERGSADVCVFFTPNPENNVQGSSKQHSSANSQFSTRWGPPPCRRQAPPLPSSLPHLLRLQRYLQPIASTGGQRIEIARQGTTGERVRITRLLCANNTVCAVCFVGYFPGLCFAYHSLYFPASSFRIIESRCLCRLGQRRKITFRDHT